MPKKPFEETPYDPIAADLVREVSAMGRRPLPAVVQSAQSDFDGNTALKLNAPPEPPQLMRRQFERCITKRFVLTRKEDDDLNAFLLRLQTQAGTKVTLSVIVRAAMSLLLHAEEQILHELGDRFPQDYPSTHDSIALGEFEERWTRCLANALRKMNRLQPT